MYHNFIAFTEYYFIVCIDYILFFHLSVDGQNVFFHLLAIGKNAAMNISIYVSV